MAQLAYRCYAKVNLTLEVLRRRADGYHDLASLVHTISLADDVSMRPADEFSSRVDGLQIDADANLVSRAACLLARTAGVSPGVDLTLIKRIPVAAGLGGGSSDAATTLVGLNALWGTCLSPSALAVLAARLGSDVPFFLEGGAAVLRGRGERLEAVAPLAHQWLVLVVPPHDVADKTPRLYAALEPLDFSSGAQTDRAAARLRQRLPPRPADLVNAFSRAARLIFPGLTGVWATVERVCERRFFLSGAGPALFALAADRADARRQETRLRRTGLVAYSARTVRAGRATVEFALDPAIKYP